MSLPCVHLKVDNAAGFSEFKSRVEPVTNITPWGMCMSSCGQKTYFVLTIRYLWKIYQFLNTQKEMYLNFNTDSFISEEEMNECI